MSNVTITRPLAPAQASNTSELRPSSSRIRRGERRCSWTRGLAVLGTAVAVLQIGSAGAFAVPPSEAVSRPGRDARLQSPNEEDKHVARRSWSGDNRPWDPAPPPR
jgi:hypothetical protein